MDRAPGQGIRPSRPCFPGQKFRGDAGFQRALDVIGKRDIRRGDYAETYDGDLSPEYFRLVPGQYSYEIPSRFFAKYNFKSGNFARILTGKYDPDEGDPKSCKGNYSADADGYYRGYAIFYIEKKSTDGGSTWVNPTVEDNALALSVSILNPDTWYTGINGVAVQVEAGDPIITDPDDARDYLDRTLKESPWDGRWYASSIWNGQLLVCFPGNKSKACKYTIAGDNWDEDENPSSFELTVPEVARIPITGNFSTEVEQWIAAYGDAETGWVQIEEATNGTHDVGMFGLIILEEPGINAADVLPLWHQESLGD